MDDGRQPPKKEQPKPTWTERSVPEQVRPGPPTRPLTDDDWNTLVPAADAIVKSAYGRTGMLPVRPLMSRGDVAADALLIQKSAKQARVLNFVVEGIHWRAGFAPEIGQTPLSQYVDAIVPPEHPLQSGTGFELRPHPTEFERVLRDIIPPALLRLEEDMFGRGAELAAFYLYYIPHGSGAMAGAFAWYLATPTGKSHVIYLQTEVKRADPRILDEMEKTFSASLVAVRANGTIPRPFDFWEEVRDATAEVQSTLRNSSFGRNAGGMRQVVSSARNQAEDSLANGISRTFARLGGVGRIAFVRLPQFALATVLRGVSGVAIATIRTIDGILARQERPPDDLPRP